MSARLPGFVTCLDLTPTLAFHCDRGELPYFREDHYWNATGNRNVAEELARTLKPLLREPGSGRPAIIPEWNIVELETSVSRYRVTPDGVVDLEGCSE